MNLLLWGLLAGSGYVAYKVYATGRDEREQAEASRQTAIRLAARELLQGKTYGVQVMVDPRDPTFGGTNTLEAASTLIRATMEQYGWKVLSNPAIRDPAKAPAFLQGQPAEWVFTGTWSRPERIVQTKPDWATMILAYELPHDTGVTMTEKQAKALALDVREGRIVNLWAASELARFILEGPDPDPSTLPPDTLPAPLEPVEPEKG